MMIPPSLPITAGLPPERWGGGKSFFSTKPPREAKRSQLGSELTGGNSNDRSEDGWVCRRRSRMHLSEGRLPLCVVPRREAEGGRKGRKKKIKKERKKNGKKEEKKIHRYTHSQHR